MGYSDDILKLTGGKGFGSIYSNKDETGASGEKNVADENKQEAVNKPVVKKIEPEKTEYIRSDQDYVIESDLVTPKIKAVKEEAEKPLVVVVDDDFETLDLLNIYLSRNYTYESFSGPREAVFFLNRHVPEIVFIDCKIHTMKALTFIEIVRSVAGNEGVPFVLVGTEDELREFDREFIPDYVIGMLKRPVARKDLVEYIDKAIESKKDK